MPSNLALDDELLTEAKRLGGHRTKRAAANEALAEYVARRKRKMIRKQFGKLDWDPQYDYKEARKRR